MIRVLVTGTHHASMVPMTKRRGIQNAIGAYAAALDDIDNVKLEVRAPTIDEDVTQYDVVIVGVVPLMAIAANWLAPTVDLFARLYEARDKVKTILAIDDFKTPLPFMTSVTTLVRHDHIIQKPFHNNKPDIDYARSHQEKWKEGLYALQAAYDEPWFDTVYCAFEFGDDAEFNAMANRMPSRATHRLDPTPYVYHDTFVPPTDKERERRWMMSALADHSKWLSKIDFAWPVDYYSSVKVKNAEMNNVTVLPGVRQEEIIERYRSCWGALLVPYKNILGTGWWRDRWVTVPRSGAVLYVGEGDAGKLGKAFRLSVEEIETMEDADLAVLSASQRAEIEEWVWQPAQLRDGLLKIIA
jgi:hypothetical protein